MYCISREIGFDFLSGHRTPGPGVGNLHRPFGRMCGRWQSGHVRPVHSPDSSALMPFAPTSLHSKPAIGWMIIHTADQGIRLGHESVTFWGIYILPDLSVVIMLLHFLRLTPVLQSHGAPLHRSFASGMQIEPPFNLTAVLKVRYPTADIRWRSVMDLV